MSTQPQSIVHQAMRLGRKPVEYVIHWERKAVNCVSRNFRKTKGSSKKMGNLIAESDHTSAIMKWRGSVPSSATESETSFLCDQPVKDDKPDSMKSNEFQLLRNSFSVLSANESSAFDKTGHNSLEFYSEGEKHQREEGTSSSRDRDHNDDTSLVVHGGGGGACCRTITQNDFFRECLLQKSDASFILHFFDDGDQSKALDLRLAELASSHTTVHFLRIKGILAPFVAPRLGVQQFPGLVAIKSGQVTDKQCDFEALGLLAGDDQWDEEFLRTWILKNNQSSKVR